MSESSEPKGTPRTSASSTPQPDGPGPVQNLIGFAGIEGAKVQIEYGDDGFATVTQTKGGQVNIQRVPISNPSRPHSGS